MNIRIKSGHISGTVFAPSSKSFTQRYILYSAFSDRTIKINNVSFSEDEIVSMKIAESCNASLYYDKKNITIRPDFKCPEKIYVGESGTSYRLTLGLLSARRCNTVITGEPSLASRPVGILTDSLSDVGTSFTPTTTGFYSVNGEMASRKHVSIDGSASSQFISAMLYYYSILGSGGFTARNLVSSDYVKITEACLETFGVKVLQEGDNYYVKTGDYRETGIDIEGDYSSSSYFIILGIFTGNIVIKNLNMDSLQPDKKILELVNNATGSIHFHQGSIEVDKAEEIKKIIVDASVSPDIAPIISVIGIFSSKGVEIRNYQRLKIKESDRWAGIVHMCRAYGASVSITDELISIKKDIIKEPDYFEYIDHRMIMSAIIAGVIAKSNTEFRNSEKINKSYPEFLNDLKKLGADIYFDANLFSQ
jgi:3-phosphoshikimate 1-carboxyvinyltransferase